jgi:hypothetical protein
MSMVLVGDIDDAVDVAEVGKVDRPRDTETQRGRREEEEEEEEEEERKRKSKKLLAFAGEGKPKVTGGNRRAQARRVAARDEGRETRRDERSGSGWLSVGGRWS